MSSVVWQCTTTETGKKGKRKSARRRKRRRRDSFGEPTGVTVVHCPQNTPSSPSTPRVAFPTTPLVEYDLPREAAPIAYSVWQRSQVGTEEHREHYTAVQDLSLAHCIDLDIIASNPEGMFRFYIKHGICTTKHSMALCLRCSTVLSGA
ncbi:uncharacterized protein FFNC_15660 [Fusarium fujikuroi]|nr:uncharacterized protein FFNC_15660 [Fusarium fujikuroi]